MSPSDFSLALLLSCAVQVIIGWMAGMVAVFAFSVFVVFIEAAVDGWFEAAEWLSDRTRRGLRP